MNSHIGWGLEGSQAQRLLSAWNWGVSLSRHSHVSSHVDVPEFLQTLVWIAPPSTHCQRSVDATERSSPLITSSFWPHPKSPQ